jgi:hypothetical protein
MRLIGLAVVVALSLIFAPLAPEAQQAGRVPTIGFLFFNAVSMPTTLPAHKSSVRGCVSSAGSKDKISRLRPGGPMPRPNGFPAWRTSWPGAASR